MRQRDKTYRYRLLALVMAVVLMLCSCGGEEDGKSSSGGDDAKNSSGGVLIVEPENPVEYSAAFSDLRLPTSVYILPNTGSVINILTEAGRYYRRELDEEGFLIEFVPSHVTEQQAEELVRFFGDGEDHLYFIWYREGEQEGSQYFLCKYAEDGQELMRKEITEQMGAGTEGEEGWNLLGAAADGEGRIYLATRTYIYLYDENGEYQGKIADIGSILAIGRGRDGKVYYTKQKEIPTSDGAQDLIEVDFDGRKPGQIYKGFPGLPAGQGSAYLTAGVQHDFLINNGEYLYGYQLKSQTTERILKWSEAGVSGQNVRYVCEQESGEILAVEGIESLQLVRLAERDENEETSGKEIITLGMTYGQDNAGSLRDMVLQFNRMQDKYEVKMKEYGESRDIIVLGDLESRDGMQAMTLELISGKGPDLILYNGNFPVYAEKGILENLNEYLEKSDVLSREDYLESILDAYTFDGKLVVLPSYFYLETCYGYSDQIGEERGMNMEEFLKLDEKYPEVALWGAPDSLNTFFDFRYLLYSFIDWENKVCSFDSEEFKQLLEFAQNGRKVESWRWGTWGNGTDEYPKLGRDYLITARILNLALTILEIRASKRDIMFIGFPVEEGNGTYIYVKPTGVGISSQSEHKEGAWEFLEYLYSTTGNGEREADGTISYPAFPAKVSRLEEYLSGLVGTKLIVDGEEYTVTKEDTDFVMNMILNATPSNLNMYAYTVFDIIYEEVSAYFAGDKPVEDVLDSIQNRVQLYLNENY